MAISIFDYSAFCISRPFNFIGCGIFWLSCIVIAEIFLITSFAIVLKRFFRDRREWRAFYQRLIDREKVANSEVMEKYIWRGE